MTCQTSRRNSIYTQLLRLLIVGAFAAVLLFSALDFAGEYLVSIYLEKTDYIEKKNLQYIHKLQKYVDQEGISTRDTEKLNDWVKKQQLLFIQIYKDEIQVFD